MPIARPPVLLAVFKDADEMLRERFLLQVPVERPQQHAELVHHIPRQGRISGVACARRPGFPAKWGIEACSVRRAYVHARGLPSKDGRVQ
jgi:hypothetical protein